MMGAIYATTFQRAKEKIFEIIVDYQLCNHQLIKKECGRKSITAYFSNGDIWCAYEHNGSNSCGRRFNVVYIDYLFYEDERKLLASRACLPPYTGITYFS